MKKKSTELNNRWKNRPQSIFRTMKRDNPYVQIDRRIYDDTRLSMKAMGLLSALLSKPNDWIISVEFLINHFKEGKAAVTSAINELIEFGYMVRITHRNTKGWVEYYEYLVFEDPSLTKEFLDKQEEEKASSKQVSDNQKPVDQKVNHRKPENPPLLKNDFKANIDLGTNNDPTKTPSYSPHKSSGEEFSLVDLQKLEPIALKLFGETNQTILNKLQLSIAEFTLEEAVVGECLKQIDTNQIKHNPYGYFAFVYASAKANVNRRKQINEEANRLQKQVMTLFPIDPPFHSPEEAKDHARSILANRSQSVITPKPDDSH